ncbi:hypothetical protein VMUT_1433 [Vulcanisaeta moutnovskia 768-28]|uniref:MCM C-terminal domain-containing protein n=1 Tax=Vulcanisaeta moutnovskia (strain 768-28) TaxID=985053 RepID=F0QT49_VULM7|nr:hypothetical protein [Vulcanisaeta moutnovskia]ADY01638.1 hypothetical protein VMUT_1433 [Vulcanisaeta moutnovskia 768-28]
MRVLGIYSIERRLRILEVCVDGCHWSIIKKDLEAMEGREFNNSTVDSLIKALIDCSLRRVVPTYYLIS